MKNYCILLFVLCTGLKAVAQQTIYVAPAPKTYWERKAEQKDKELLYRMMLADQQRANLNKDIAEGQKCGDQTRSFYLGMAEFPTIADGVHTVQFVENTLGICNKGSVVVKNGKVVSLGKDAVTADGPVKNARTKVASVEADGKTYFFELYFLYEQ